jgi:hypothetical protein
MKKYFTSGLYDFISLCPLDFQQLHLLILPNLTQLPITYLAINAHHQTFANCYTVPQNLLKALVLVFFQALGM